MRKQMIRLLILVMLFIIIGIQISATTLVPIPKTSSSGYVTYRNTSTQVLIPTEYTIQDNEFRGVWVSPLVNDIGSYLNDISFKNELLSVLDQMEYFNLNAIVFHVRIMNDALYNSDLNIKSPYVSGANFERWDYLEWFIGECHRRGIEFHAWLNPYRIASSSTSKAFITSKYANYPQNPASKEENIIIGTSGAILNPGEPAVRNFVVDTCMELIERYDIDAIHFDDYFYASMAYDADAATYNKYKALSQTTNLYDWRREQVDLFIEDLSTTMRAYNLANHRHVQLGIAPTGIWRNGNGQVSYDVNGTAITSGSNTAGQEHYASYLYANTKKWVDNEWIDYICPQSYWSFELTAAPYADVVDWWAKVVRYKNVNLYTGMGLYRRYSGDSGASWETNPMEAANQVLYNTKHPEIQGTIIFNYRYLRDSKGVAGVNKIVTEYWNHPVATPIIRTMTQRTPNSVANVDILKTNQGFVLHWNEATDAQRYVVYRSTATVDVNDPTQVVGIVGKNSHNDVLFEDVIDNTLTYQYAIVALSGTGHTSSPLIQSTTQLVTSPNFTVGDFQNISLSGTVFPSETIQLSFQEAVHYAGNPFTYTVVYSKNGVDWLTVTESSLRKSGTSYSQFLTFPASGHPLYLKVIGENDLATIESDIVNVRMQIDGIIDYLDFAFYIMQSRTQQILPTKP